MSARCADYKEAAGSFGTVRLLLAISQDRWLNRQRRDQPYVNHLRLRIDTNVRAGLIAVRDHFAVLVHNVTGPLRT